MHCSSNTKLSRNDSGNSLYFDQKGGGIPNTFKGLKVFNFFVDCSIIDAKTFFVAPTLWYLMHSRGKLIVRHCTSSILLDFYFNQQSGGIPRILIRNLKLFIFFVNCSFVDATFLYLGTQWYLMH